MCHKFVAGFAFVAASWAGMTWVSAQTHAAAANPSIAVAAPWSAEHDVGPAFAPDDDTVVFARGRSTARRLYISHRRHGRWSPPQHAPFSNQWMDFEPMMAPDGSYLVFVSNRPARAGGKPLDGFFNGKLHANRGGNLWRVDYRNGKWGKPVRLPDIVNVGTSVYSPTVSADGSIYFTLPDPHTHNTRIYVSHRAGSRYQAPQAVAFSKGVISDYDPAVAPDGSFIVFSSDRPPTPQNHSGLFVAFRTGDGWRRPEPLGVYGYEARLSPDTHTLYFTADDNGRIHRFDLAAWRVRNGGGTAR